MLPWWKKIYTSKKPMDKFQEDALTTALAKGKYGIFFEQRVGKTRVAIDFVGVQHVKAKKNKILVVTPLSVRTTWKPQVDEYFPYGYILNYFPCPLPDTPIVPYFVLINYDKMSKYSADILKWKPDVVIFDEIHLLKGHSSKRSRVCARIARDVPYVLGLTGTPIPKYPHDVFGIFRAINPKVYGDNWRKFQYKYCELGGYLGKQIVGYKDLDALTLLMESHSIRVLRKDVMDEPNVEDVVVPIEFEPRANRIYHELRHMYVTELREGLEVTAGFAAVRLMRLHQICGGFLKSDKGEVGNVSSAKLDATEDLILSKVEGGEKVLVFHAFRAEGTELSQRLRYRGIKMAEYNGDSSELERELAVLYFQETDKIDVMVIQISTGSLGLKLDASHTNIFYSLTYKLSDLQQARDRVMGREQKHDVTNYFMVVENSVDEKVVETLRNNQDLASSIADTWRWLLEKKEDK